MKSLIAWRFAAIAVLVGACAQLGQSQDPKEEPGYKTLELKAGFPDDPAVVMVEAGGDIERKEEKGGGMDGPFVHFVAKKPDVRLKYTAGDFPLTIYAQSEADTTLLIHTPDGKWIANDDGPGTGLNPLIKFAKPASGQYDIWVGCLKEKEFPKAKLFITELK